MSTVRKLFLAAVLTLLGALALPADAAISYVDDNTANSSSANTLTPTEPTGAAQDDIIVAMCGIAASGGTWTDPADFTEFSQEDFGTGGNVGSAYLGYKVRGSGAGSGYQFSSSSSAAQMSCTVIAYRGVDTTTPFDVTFSEATYKNETLNDLANTAAQPVTTVTDNAWVLVLQRWVDAIATVTQGAPSGYTADSAVLQASRALLVAHKLVASHGTETPGAWTNANVPATADSINYTLALRPAGAGAAPTFTAGPTAGTITTTTIPTTFTSDQTGTAYGVACPDGQTAPTVAQVIAGNCTGNVAAVNAWSEAVVATVGDSHSFTSLVPGTRYDLSFAQHGTSLDSAAISALANQDTVALAFTANPSCSAATNGVSCTYTSNLTSTVYGVGVNPGDGTPTCTQIKAGQNDGGTAALWAGSDANTTAVGDTVTVTGSNTPVRMNMHFCLNGSGADSAVYSGQTNKDRSARSGYAIVSVASISATSICDLDSYFTPDVAVGDQVEYKTTSTPGGYTVAFTTDCDFTVAAGGDTSQQHFEVSYQDVSNVLSGLFTAPTVGIFSSDDTIYVNNSAPDCTPDFGDDVVLLYKNVAMATVDLVALGGCTDADADTPTITLDSGSVPTGTSRGGTGNKDWTGTPTVENETGTAITVRDTDPAGDSDTYAFTVYVTDDVVVAPNCSTGSVAVAACLTLLDVVRPWLEPEDQLTATFAFSATIAVGNIVSQLPAAAGTMTATAPLAVVVSLGPAPAATSATALARLRARKAPDGMRVIH